jgi:hypothetical protein
LSRKICNFLTNKINVNSCIIVFFFDITGAYSIEHNLLAWFRFYIRTPVAPMTLLGMGISSPYMEKKLEEWNVGLRRLIRKRTNSKFR